MTEPLRFSPVHLASLLGAMTCGNNTGCTLPSHRPQKLVVMALHSHWLPRIAEHKRLDVGQGSVTARGGVISEGENPESSANTALLDRNILARSGTRSRTSSGVSLWRSTGGDCHKKSLVRFPARLLILAVETRSIRSTGLGILPIGSVGIVIGAGLAIFTALPKATRPQPQETP